MKNIEINKEVIAYVSETIDMCRKMITHGERLLQLLNKEEDQKRFTKEEVRKALAGMSAKGHGKEARAILKRHGASTLSELSEDEYAAVMKEAFEYNNA